MATSNKAKAAGPKTKGLAITAKRERFFSGGITEPFGFEARTIALADLTEDQVEELKADTFLIVKEVEVDVPAEEPAAK